MEQLKLHSLLHPYFDGELDFSESLAFEEHLAHCSDCTLILEEQKKLRAVLAQSSLRYIAPKELKQKVRSTLKKNGESRKIIFQWNWKIYGVAASIAIAFVALWMLIPKESSNNEAALTNEIVSSHVRSLMASHLFDIASTDQHTVKPWFAGKLNFSPTVKDFSAQGFQLIGGRLDYIDGKPVAALVYQHQKHLINVFEWTGEAAQNEKSIIEHERGFNVIGDQSGGIRLWLVSDLNAEELAQLADMLK
jgi:anti-sigma factor RsiW